MNIANKSLIANNGPNSGLGLQLVERSFRLLNLISFSCLLALIVLAVIPYGTVDAWWEAVFESAVFALTAIWIIELLLGGNLQAKRLIIIAPLLLMTAYAFSQTIAWPAWLPMRGRLTSEHTLSIDRYQTYLTARKILALTLFLGLLLWHTSTPKRLRWLVRVVVGIGLVSALFAILRQFLQSPDSPNGFVLPFLFYGTGFGHFISPNAFAYLMEMTLGLLAGLLLGGGVSRDRLLIYLAFIIPVWAALVLSNSRGGLVGMTVQAILLAFISLDWYSRRNGSQEARGKIKQISLIATSRLVRLLGIVLIVGMLVAAVLWMGGENLSVKLAQQGPTYVALSDGSTRREIWHSTGQLIKQNPWTGVGFGAYFLAITKYQVSSGALKLEQAHSDPLDLAANGGVVALVLAACFIAMLIWRARSSLRSVDFYRRAASLGAIAGMLSVAIHSLVDFGLQLTGIAAVFAAMTVIAVADNGLVSVPGERRNGFPQREPTPSNRVDSSAQRGISWLRLLSLPLVLLGLFACYRLIVGAGNFGLSRLLQTGAILSSSIEPANRAVGLAPGDPEAHYTRGLTLANQQKLGEAADELRQATRLRPFHYYQWLDLGLTLDRLGDQTGAHAALLESVRLAPSFVQPRWQLGNFLYREGRIEEAFSELRLGAQSNPSFFAGMLGLAWASANGDVSAFESLVRPVTSRNHLEVAKFLAAQGKGSEAARQVQLAGVPEDQAAIDLWRQTMAILLASHMFNEAYAAWAATHTGVGGNNPRNAIINGDFVDPIIKDDLGFGWQLPSVQGISVSIDPAGPDAQGRSLGLNYNGNSAVNAQTIYQIVILEPASRYSLTFMARTEKLVSGGPPVVFILDASGKIPTPLGRSKPIAVETSGWTEYQIDFSTDSNTSAATISLQRTACSEGTCPIFGNLWLSRFRIKKVE